MIVELIQRHTLLCQKRLDLAAEFFGHIEALGRQMIQPLGQMVAGVLQLDLQHLIQPVILF